MDTEEKDKKIEEIYRLVKENSQILAKMRKAQKWRSVFSALYWLVILGVAGASYYFAQPYFESLLSTYGSLLE